MNTVLFTLMLYLSTIFNPGVITMEHPGSVDKGLQVLRYQYPEWTEHYEEDEFDCSEMSALVAQYFKVSGYKNVEVKNGYSRDIGAHTWVVVEGEIIEATGLYISHDKLFYDQFYSRGSRQMYCESDWWNSNYIKQQGGGTI